MRFSLVEGVGMNLSPLESKFICSFVSCSFERFLIIACVTLRRNGIVFYLHFFSALFNS